MVVRNSEVAPRFLGNFWTPDLDKFYTSTRQLCDLSACRGIQTRKLSPAQKPVRR